MFLLDSVFSKQIRDKFVPDSKCEVGLNCISLQEWLFVVFSPHFY